MCFQIEARTLPSCEVGSSPAATDPQLRKTRKANPAPTPPCQFALTKTPTTPWTRIPQPICEHRALSSWGLHSKTPNGSHPTHQLQLRNLHQRHHRLEVPDKEDLEAQLLGHKGGSDRIGSPRCSENGEGKLVPGAHPALRRDLRAEKVRCFLSYF